MENKTTPQMLTVRLKRKFQKVVEGIAKQANQSLINSFHTDLYVTEGDSRRIYDEYGFRTKATLDTATHCNDIFKPPPEHEKPIRTVMTKGIVGIGKTASVQKFILDWAEGKANQDVHLIFDLPFRQLNLVKNRKYSLLGLIRHFYPEMKGYDSAEICRHKILIIFDGLNEGRLALNFQNNESLTDVTEPTSVDVLLTNVIKGNLLPSALLWITSRPAAANQIPSEWVHRVTEVRGFSDSQQEEYLRESVQDQSLASRIIAHIQSSRSLCVMCRVPVFCWISATVLETMLSKEDAGKIPKTLTELYTHFLLIQTNLKRQGRTGTDPENVIESDGAIILKLGELAFENLENGNLLLNEEDVRKVGIDVSIASVLSEVCIEHFREDSGMYRGRMFSFIHLSVQEYLAALHVFLSFSNDDRNLLDQTFRGKGRLFDLHKTAVDQASQSQTGHLDLFLQFLLGLSLDSTQSHLEDLLARTGSSSHNTQEIVQYVKEKIRKSPSSERSVSLLHCLNELSDVSVGEEIRAFLRTVDDGQGELGPSEWSGVVFALLTSDEDLDDFEMRTFSRSQDGPLRLLPVVKFARRALLWQSDLTESCCDVLASALSSSSSHLRELDLSLNELQDSGVRLICAGLESAYCKLEKLELRWCKLTGKCCGALASALRSNPHLRELDLSNNELQDSGVKLLSAGLESPLCKLETLRLEQCKLGGKGCKALATALRSNSSSLRELYLSSNDLQDSGVELLSVGLENPLCNLEILRMDECRLTGKCCGALASTLRSNPHLRELDLSNNELQDSGVKLLSAGLEAPLCELEKLGLWGCELTGSCCDSLAAALGSSSSHLRVLDLSHNDLQDSGVKLLSAGLNEPHCSLEKLVLIKCSLTDKCCDALASAVRSNSSLLRKLDLSLNDLQDSGVVLLSAGLDDPHCKLQKLELQGCKLTESSCDALASAFGSSSSHLRKLDVSSNDLQDAGVERLCAGLENPHCKLEKLELVNCGVTSQGCASLALALRSNPSRLRELNLSLNDLQDSGQKLLSVLQKDPLFRLETLEY